MIWIKIEHTTPDKPQVGKFADILGISRDEALGTLVRLWIWADQHVTKNGLTTATEAELDYHARREGCAQSLKQIGWLKLAKGGLKFVHFDEHNGESSKQRALTNRRVSKLRNGAGVTKSAPEKRREEKRREEEEGKKQQLSAAPAAKAGKPRSHDEVWDSVCELFGQNPSTRKERNRVGAIVRDLKAKGASGYEIAYRRAVLVWTWPEATATMESLVKHWDEMGQPPQRPLAMTGEQQQRWNQVENARIRRACGNSKGAAVVAGVEAHGAGSVPVGPQGALPQQPH
jgi:hypothetical protein